MVLSRVRLIRVKLVLVNLNPINDTYRHETKKNSKRHVIQKKRLVRAKKIQFLEQKENLQCWTIRGVIMASKIYRGWEKRWWVGFQFVGYLLLLGVGTG